MAARLNPLKDTEALVAAAGILRDRGVEVLVRIAGDGPSARELQQQVTALGLSDQVLLDGMLSEDELIVWLRGLDLYVHASHGEVMSTSVLQAFATGLPCVVSDAPGLTTLAEGADGEGVILVPTCDPGAIAAAVAELLSDPERRRRMGVLNRRRALRDHGIGRMTDGDLGLLTRLDPDGPWAAARGSVPSSGVFR